MTIAVALILQGTVQGLFRITGSLICSSLTENTSASFQPMQSPPLDCLRCPISVQPWRRSLLRTTLPSTHQVTNVFRLIRVLNVR